MLQNGCLVEFGHCMLPLSAWFLTPSTILGSMWKVSDRSPTCEVVDGARKPNTMSCLLLRWARWDSRLWTDDLVHSTIITCKATHLQITPSTLDLFSCKHTPEQERSPQTQPLSLTITFKFCFLTILYFGQQSIHDTLS